MDYYRILGLSPTSEPEVIEAAYRALMKKYHPDKWVGRSAEAEQRTKTINEAYAVLRDPRRRSAYDNRQASAHLRASQARTPQQGAKRDRTKRWATEARGHVRRSAAQAVPSTLSFEFGRSEIVGAAVVLAAVFGLAATTTRNSAQPNVSRAIVPAASTRVSSIPLVGKVEQIFCITNKTVQPVQYRVFWGDTSSRNYEINPGTSMVHYARYVGSPSVEFFTKDGSEAVRRRAVGARSADGPDRSCDPRYSFEYNSVDDLPSLADAEFDLYPGAPAVSAAKSPEY